MKYIFLLALILIGCNTDPVPPGPGPTPNPEPQKEYATGLLKPRDRQYGVLHFIPKNLKGPIPAEFSWEDKGFETPVRDQGNCGSCWAFGGTQTLEMAYKIFAGKTIDFSEQDLVGKLYSGCGGGWFTGEHQVSKGQTDEQSCPYRASNSKCPTSAKPVGKGISWGMVGKPGRAPSEDELQNSILTYGPIAVTVTATGAFMNIGAGLHTGCPHGQTNHIVTLTGWKTGTDGKIYFKIKNSWGTGWGVKGYGFVKAGCYDLAEDASWIAIEAIPCPPPKIRMPKSITVEPGEEIVLAVKKIEGVTYAWYEGTKLIGDTNLLVIVPEYDTVYRVVAKNQCGEAEIQTMILTKTSLKLQ